MDSRLVHAKRWNDEGVIKSEKARDLLRAFEVEHRQAETVESIMKGRRDVMCVNTWLSKAFLPLCLKVNQETITVYLNFFLRKLNHGDALQYLNDERQKRGLAHIIGGSHCQPPPQEVGLAHRNFQKFKKVSKDGQNRVTTGPTPSLPSKRLSVQSQPITQGMRVALPSDKARSARGQVPLDTKSVGMVIEEKLEHRPVASMLQKSQNVSVASLQSKNKKRKGLGHDMQFASQIIDRVPDRACLEPSLVGEALADKPDAKRRKVDNTPLIVVDNERATIRKPIMSTKIEGHENYLLQDGGALDACSGPSSSHDILGAHPITIGSEEQAPDLLITNKRKFPAKPDLPQYPPIWAESRQEVCEVFDWFRSYQSGVYHAENAVKGYLLGAFSSQRDVFENDGKLIISHGGGKSEFVGCQKGLFVSHQASDQGADDKSVRALLDNYHSGRPLALLVDDKYALFPYDLSSKGVTYAVLGFYSIVYAWAEFQSAKNEVGRVIRYKFAFRWCEEQGTPWWFFGNGSEPISKQCSMNKDESSRVPQIVSDDGVPPKGSSMITSNQTQSCSFCANISHKVYSTWVCLSTNCKMFWKDQETTEFLPDNLEYNQAFFTLTPRFPLSSGLNLLDETTVTCGMNGASTSYAFTRGIHCPDCGRLSSRYQWEQLKCRACPWTMKADINIRSAKDIWGDFLPISFMYFQMSPVSDFIVEPIRCFKHENGMGEIQSFTLPYNRGHIHHIRSPTPSGMLEADEIFKHYQEQAKSGIIEFRRWPLRAHKCRGILLTNYFSHNAGEQYQYVGGSEAKSSSFEQVPAVAEARWLIQKRILQALGITAEFNELLSCAYMERQKMAFHSDAEVGLGPLVAGLSLGSPALMHFRLHARHDLFYEQRGILLTLVLRHGDVLVMDGNGIQEYYEHTVIPNNFRIAATARQITPLHLQTDKPS